MSRYRQTMSEALKQVRGIKEQDDKDHEISMARGELQAIADKATQLSSALQGKSDEGNPLEAWVQSKITKAKDYINSVSDYLMYNPDMKQNEEVNETPQGYALVQKAKEIAKKFANNMSKAVAEIEKLEKGLSKNSSVKDALQKANESLEEKYTVVITKKDGTTMELGRYNTPAEAQRYVDQYGKGAKVKKEEVELDEIDEKISDIFKANKEGESIDDIAKRLKLSTSMVKKLIGEAKDEEEKKEEPKKEEDNKEHW
jgi:DNA invertase Pin-like site-specific DNA recombinase